MRKNLRQICWQLYCNWWRLSSLLSSLPSPCNELIRWKAKLALNEEKIGQGVWRLWNDATVENIFVLVVLFHPFCFHQNSATAILKLLFRFQHQHQNKQMTLTIQEAWALVVVKWSACSPSSPTIWVRIPLKSTILLVKLYLKRTKINKKRQGLAHLKNIQAEGSSFHTKAFHFLKLILFWCAFISFCCTRYLYFVQDVWSVQKPLGSIFKDSVQ